MKPDVVFPTSHTGLYEIKADNNDPLNKQITGQYVLKELILDIASWISPDFYFQCNSVVMNYFVKEYQMMDQSVFKAKLKEVEKGLSNIILEKDSVIAEKDNRIDELIRLSHI